MRRVVLVTPFSPDRDGRHGGARASRGIILALAERHKLVVVLPGDNRQVDPRVARHCVAVRTLPVRAGGRWSRRLHGSAALVAGRSLWAADFDIRELQRCVRGLCAKFRPDVVQVEHGVLGDALAAAAPGQLRVLTVYDPAGSRRESIPLRSDGLPWVHRLDARAALRQERRVLALADAAVVFTERDRQLLAGTAAATELATIPLGWDVPRAALDPVGGQPRTLLFVGNFVHAPNVDAAITLAYRILPIVLRAHPETRLAIVGGSPPPEVLALAGDRVSVSADVPSVTPYLNSAAIVVAPIAIGGGMRVKVLEALAAGKAVVASTRAAEGVTAVSGEEIAVVDGDAPTAAAICSLLEDNEARRQMAARARLWALRELSWSTMADRYDELYARLDRRRSGRPRLDPPPR